MQNLGDKLPFICRERLSQSNRELPPLVRLLFPAIKTWDQFASVRDDPEWLAQKGRLSKKCYEVLSERLVFLAKQSERLEEVKTSFKHGLLSIMSKGQVQLEQPANNRVKFSKSTI